MNNSLKGKKIVLAVTGSIAAYKAVDIASKLTQADVSLHILLTKEAAEFVTPLSFQNISRQKISTDLFSSEDNAYLQHLESTYDADAFLIAPATANTIAKLAIGIADDLVSTAFLAATCPVIIAPAMDLNMYDNPSTQSNVKTLQKRGVIFAGPEQGRLASGKVGRGRLMEPNNIIDLLKTTLGAYGDFAGKRIVITAGPTVEHIDPVRIITNPSSGKMGFALATASRDRGAKVTLISGPTYLETPFGVTKIDVKSAKQMYTAVLKSVINADILIMAAAVSDFRPTNPHTAKEKKSIAKLTLPLETTEDILASVPDNLLKIGFAAETEDIERNATSKLSAKNLDLIIANDISQPGTGFASDFNQV
ncbi:MAG: bifunctional phosphopantothenoylcysteine decarboxylase/phosphopantothenate--cysteine ligase CoaBC, partial [Dehalococcoidia bacterium]|nr:bifunctional phosphopantothenoylcysteine decarboxylase/phosphopantothenate--cysteine ligase CoaBC [Dehalococcoidia bacterium]